MQTIPYCGLPPIPSEIWRQWNGDPLLIVALAVLGILWAVGAYSSESPDSRRPMPSQASAFLAGYGLLWIAFVSPLCSLTMALFSARVGQHLMLALIAAPLLAYARPTRSIASLLGFASVEKDAGVVWLVTSATAFAALFWFWHLPDGYALTLQSDLAYWTMHLSLLGSAICLWHGFFHVKAPARPAAVLAALLTGAQMTILSALIVFSTSLWHDWHGTTTFAWNLTPIEDQILGGTIMWVFGAALFLSVLITVGARWVNAEDRRFDRTAGSATSPGMPS